MSLSSSFSASRRFKRAFSCSNVFSHATSSGRIAHIGYATADMSDAKSLNVASLQQAEYSPPTTGRPHAVCEQSAQVYVWFVSSPSSQPHSCGITYLIGDGPISRVQDIYRNYSYKQNSNIRVMTGNTNRAIWILRLELDYAECLITNCF